MGPRSEKVLLETYYGPLGPLLSALSWLWGLRHLGTLHEEGTVDGSNFAGRPRGHCRQASAMPGGRWSWPASEVLASGWKT